MKKKNPFDAVMDVAFGKTVGAVLGALLLLMLFNFATGKIYGTRHGSHDEEHVYAFAVETGVEVVEEAEPEPTDYAALVASADIGAGEKVFNKCKSCHKVEDGAGGVGPHLWGIVGRDIAALDGFSYSGDLANAEGDWTLEELSAFLENPKGYAPGTKMNFKGLSKPEDRVNLIVWLNEADGSPIPLP